MTNLRRKLAALLEAIDKGAPDLAARLASRPRDRRRPAGAQRAAG
jgi:hypothetical protein